MAYDKCSFVATSLGGSVA